MSKPTKFDLMRAGRERAEWMRSSLQYPRLHQPACPISEPVVPTMEIDGVKYHEAPEREGANVCDGCAFYGLGGRACDRTTEPADTAFGVHCMDRNVIYIRAT